MKFQVQILTTNFNQEATFLVPVRRACHKVFTTTAMIEPQGTENNGSLHSNKDSMLQGFYSNITGRTTDNLSWQQRSTTTRH